MVVGPKLVFLYPHEEFVCVKFDGKDAIALPLGLESSTEEVAVITKEHVCLKLLFSYRW